MTFGSLFAGVGGMDLGLERAGMECKWQVEIDPYCTKVLEKHWPGVKRYGDITRINGAELERVDLIAGGFPCQDVSRAGIQRGIHGARSGLYQQMLQIVGVVRPRFVVVENVAALLGDGLGHVLADLATRGFDAEWAILPASVFGAPHRRDRLFLVAYSACKWMDERSVVNSIPDKAWRKARLGEFGGMDGATACREAIANVCRDDDGIPDWMDRTAARDVRGNRLKGLGNAVVPQVAEWIGRRIIEADQERAA